MKRPTVVSVKATQKTHSCYGNYCTLYSDLINFWFLYLLSGIYIYVINPAKYYLLCLQKCNISYRAKFNYNPVFR